jgi:hypothetical protein
MSGKKRTTKKNERKSIRKGRRRDNQSMETRYAKIGRHPQEHLQYVGGIFQSSDREMKPCYS